ncbi:hypothetical protein BpHYR1_053585 [Brachionus plicatilis]|uniref:Uncharacterized protein n=1 Tax=Brachionus plicatilis TaxID=10195 RepID=A0A3M7QU83_BRAPC|nr:hypothetical protein BpHYR1_053585 [Brachionus plicatilis]
MSTFLTNFGTKWIRFVYLIDQNWQNKIVFLKITYLLSLYLFIKPFGLLLKTFNLPVLYLYENICFIESQI